MTKHRHTVEEAARFSKHGIDLIVYGQQDPSATVARVDVEHGHCQEFYNVRSSYTYYIVSGHGVFYLDDEAVEAGATDLITVSPGIRVHYFGRMQMILIVAPAFDEQDERHVRFIDIEAAQRPGRHGWIPTSDRTEISHNTAMVSNMSDQATDSIMRTRRPGPALLEIRDGDVSVTLPEGHPGYGDERYVERREWIAAAAVHARSGDPAPHVVYSRDDCRVWQQVYDGLRDLHRRHASATYLESFDSLDLPSDRPPQLRAVSDTIEESTGFTMAPVAGSIGARTFYESLADRTFRATQYIRHASRPGFSPEPDMIHEVLGHGPHLVNDRWARVYQLAGDAVRRLRNPSVVELVSRIFWFGIECGLVSEGGETKVWGASLLSSTRELANFQNADIRPLDLARMAKQDYNSHASQPVLFVANSQAHLQDFLSEFFATVDDDSAHAVNF